MVRVELGGTEGGRRTDDGCDDDAGDHAGIGFGCVWAGGGGLGQAIPVGLDGRGGCGHGGGGGGGLRMESVVGRWARCVGLAATWSASALLRSSGGIFVAEHCVPGEE